MIYRCANSIIFYVQYIKARQHHEASFVTHIYGRCTSVLSTLPWHQIHTSQGITTPYHPAPPYTDGTQNGFRAERFP